MTGVDLSRYLAPLRETRGSVTPMHRGLGAISRHMGIHDSIVSLWSRGKRPVPLARIPALRAALAAQGVVLPEDVEHLPPVEPPAPLTEADEDTRLDRALALMVTPLRTGTTWTTDILCLLCGERAEGMGRRCPRCGCRSVVREREEVAA